MADVIDRQTIKALSADARQDIMKLLAKRPYTASEISKITRKHVTTVAEHLEVLEKSQLVKKKESTNKWVYYTLTQKGEHLFKPQFYSWIVVFSISAVLMFTGFLRIFKQELNEKALSAMAPASGAQTAVAAASIDMTGILLILIALIGFGYMIYNIRFKKKMIP